MFFATLSYAFTYNKNGKLNYFLNYFGPRFGNTAKWKFSRLYFLCSHLMLHDRCTYDYFYLNDLFKSNIKMTNKFSINRYFGRKFGPQLKMNIILKFELTFCWKWIICCFHNLKILFYYMLWHSWLNFSKKISHVLYSYISSHRRYSEKVLKIHRKTPESLF